MAAIPKILGIVLFLGLIAQGIKGQCTLSNLSVSQSQTGAKVQSKPEWLVTISNNCSCVQVAVILNCKGFQTVEKLDPAVVTYDMNDCLIQQAVYQDSPVTFKYAWDHSFPLTPETSIVECH